MAETPVLLVGRRNDLAVVERSRDQLIESSALASGYSALQAKILAGRLRSVRDDSVSRTINPSSSDFDPPELLPDIGVASELIAGAVAGRKPIAIVTDHDADGATSHAIIRLSLLAMGVAPEQISGFLSHRLSEGYGVSDAVVDRMLPKLSPGTCIITADQGSTDEPRIARLRAAGHSVIVTDHHGIADEGPPASANAVVNPVRADSLFPDKAIAGCHTALLVMAAVRDVLIQLGVLASNAPRVSALLDLCAVGTVADASSMGQSRNNRLIVQVGLRIMNSAPRPCWKAMRQLLGKTGEWNASDIAFQIATRINARGRLSDAMLSVEFLCAEDEHQALSIARQLDENNRQRRAIERELTQKAIGIAESAVREGRFGLCLWLGDASHPGVHGITAHRVVDRFGRPTVCLSPVSGSADLVTGSIRTTEVVDVREALSSIRRHWPALLISAGGHRGAGGLKIRRQDIDHLTEAWDETVRARYQQQVPGPKLMVDGDLSAPSIDHALQTAALEPFGREFEQPVFTGEWCVDECRRIGDGTHLKLKLSNLESVADAVWFGATSVDSENPVAEGTRYLFAYVLDLQTYRGKTRLQLQIRALAAARTSD